jgi:8-oxo-dGTP diphosphatase
MSQVVSRPGVGVAVFVWKDGKFIMGQRIGTHGKNTWSIPGGHLEMSETIEEAAEREVMEETGMKVQNIRFLAITNDIFPATNKHYVSIWVEADWSEGEPVVNEPDTYVKFQWKDFQNLPTPLFEPCWENLRKEIPERFAS